MHTTGDLVMKCSPPRHHAASIRRALACLSRALAFGAARAHQPYSARILVGSSPCTIVPESLEFAMMTKPLPPSIDPSRIDRKPQLAPVCPKKFARSPGLAGECADSEPTVNPLYDTNIVALRQAIGSVSRQTPGKYERDDNGGVLTYSA